MQAQPPVDSAATKALQPIVGWTPMGLQPTGSQTPILNIICFEETRPHADFITAQRAAWLVRLAKDAGVASVDASNIHLTLITRAMHQNQPLFRQTIDAIPYAEGAVPETIDPVFHQRRCGSATSVHVSFYCVDLWYVALKHNAVRSHVTAFGAQADSRMWCSFHVDCF